MTIRRRIRSFLGAPWWAVLVGALLLTAVSFPLLRQNKIRANELYAKVIEVDQTTGDIKKIEPELMRLRAYVLTHMNATLDAPVSLAASYNRAAEQARERAQTRVDTSIYDKAQASCERADIPLTARAQCIQDYVLTNAPPGSAPIDIEYPPVELFYYDFASPRWSPDAAGFAVLGALIAWGWLGVLAARFHGIPRLVGIIKNDPLE